MREINYLPVWRFATIKPTHYRIFVPWGMFKSELWDAGSWRGIKPVLNLRVAQKIRPRRQVLDQNRKTPISKPAANAQRPNVQAETTRTRLRRSCDVSWD
jgi:hypothetical protein